METKKYRAIFFDWDGTAVKSRKAPADEVIPLMTELLRQNVVLIIISGTTYENIASGELHQLIPVELKRNLYLGLGRGAYNYGFDNDGIPILLKSSLPKKEELLRIHKFCFELHYWLLEKHNIQTDIVFSRPNYCKVDLMVDYDRGDHQYLKGSEVELVNSLLERHKLEGGLQALIHKTKKLSQEFGMDLKPTTDAKFLEIGPTTKADNVRFFMEKVIIPQEIDIKTCGFWGDEFGFVAPTIKGSDAEMIIPHVEGADFFDVNEEPSELPRSVKSVGGGVPSFLNFLKAQIKIL